MQKTEVQKTDVVNSREYVQPPLRVPEETLHEAVKRYGLSERDVIDFSSNVNPLGPSSSAVRAAKRALTEMHLYPDPGMTGLRKAIARYFGIKPEQVTCGNGSTELIYLIPRVFRPRKVLVPMPAFTEYAAAASVAGAEVVPLYLPERTGFRIDPLEIAFALKGVDMAFLGNPNNPTGLLMTKAEMLEIANYALEQGVRLVIDEAFMDFTNAESTIKEAVQTSHLICLRSFSTFFGMPGLRIGYAVSGESVIGEIQAGQEPWTINRAAEHAAIAALNDWRYTKKTLRLMEKERERLLSAVRILPGVETFPGSANFLFIKVAEPKAALLAHKLALRGFLIRDCSSFPGLDSRFLRIAVRTGRENKKLILALRELLTR